MIVAPLATLLLVGCNNTTRTGPVYEPISASEVRVSFDKDRLVCKKLEEIGFIATPLVWNQSVAIDRVREEAAKVGANYAIVQTVHKNAYNDASASAIAYRCNDRSHHHPTG
jgi:hypothetical protein